MTEEDSQAAEPTDSELTDGFYAFGVVYESERFKAWQASRSERYANYRLEWNARVRDRRPESLPLNINVEVTTRCNLACTFCSHPSLLPSQTGDLPLPMYEKVLADSAPLGGIAAINLNGLGEPMLRQDLDEFVALGHEHGASDIYFHTNGTRMNTESDIERLIDAGLDRIVVSVDSPDRETYESMRLVKGAWDSAQGAYRQTRKGSPHDLLVRNVRRLIEVCRQRGNDGPMVRVTCVLTEKTLPQMSTYRDFWMSEGADVITYQDLTWRDKISADDVRNQVWTSSESSVLEDEYEYLRSLPEDVLSAFACPPLYQSMWIEFDGQVVPCSHPDARQHMVMGHLSDQSLPEIWQGEEYSQLRAQHESGEWVNHPVCGRCEVPLIEIRKRLSGRSVASEVVEVEAF